MPLEPETTTVGVTGQRWRASVAPWGAVTPWETPGASGDAGRRLDWFIAADDRWHDPAAESAVRQRRIDGTPVLETRVRVPDGDAVHRVWSVADAGGLTIVEVENDSPLPFAIAFAGGPILTDRAPADVPIQGIELPADAVALPVGHRSAIRVAIPHGPGGHGAAGHLASAPGADAVARGWVRLAEQASRLDLPDEGLGAAVVAARCDLLLEGPVDPVDDAIGFVLDVGELVRLGDDARDWLPDIVGPAERAARTDVPQVVAALDAAQRVARSAGDGRAEADIVRLRRRVVERLDASYPLAPFSELRRTGSTGRFVTAVERHLADGGALLPAGLPSPWFGSNFEVHGVPTSADSAVSFALRWHGERAAVLWEQDGPPCRLTAPAVDRSWSADAPSGEALWSPAPPRRTAATLDVATVRGPASPDSTSFS